MDSAEWGSLLIALVGFFALGHVINYLAGSAYWWWTDRRASKEDEKMLKEQEKAAQNAPDNVVRLDDIRNRIIISNYDDDTIH
jgi:hypothetical protein